MTFIIQLILFFNCDIQLSFQLIIELDYRIEIELLIFILKRFSERNVDKK